MKVLPDMRIEPATVRTPGGRPSDQATCPVSGTVTFLMKNLDLTLPHNCYLRTAVAVVEVIESSELS